jgi:hypothetical protein
MMSGKFAVADHYSGVEAALKKVSARGEAKRARVRIGSEDLGQRRTANDDEDKET